MSKRTRILQRTTQYSRDVDAIASGRIGNRVKNRVVGRALAKAGFWRMLWGEVVVVTRAEHIAWCKERALEYLPRDPAQALASMASDLGKHPETQSSQDVIAFGMTHINNPQEMRKFIEGFN
jgi:hypothetical protein